MRPGLHCAGPVWDCSVRTAVRNHNPMRTRTARALEERVIWAAKAVEQVVAKGAVRVAAKGAMILAE